MSNISYPLIANILFFSPSYTTCKFWGGDLEGTQSYSTEQKQKEELHAFILCDTAFFAMLLIARRRAARHTREIIQAAFQTFTALYLYEYGTKKYFKYTNRKEIIELNASLQDCFLNIGYW